MTEEQMEYINKWMLKAGNDFDAAIILIERENPLTDIVCFHCQQAVEKYLKAYLIYQNIDFPKTHILKPLLRLCIKVNKDFESIKLKDLSYFGVQVRYPDDSYLPTIEEAKEYICIAKKVMELVNLNITF